MSRQPKPVPLGQAFFNQSRGGFNQAAATSSRSKKADMKHHLLILLALLTSSACAASSSSTSQETAQKAQRQPLQKSQVKLQSPIVYEKREDIVKNGKTTTYDPKPQIVAVDEKAGKYELRWIGYDGKEKVVAYQRTDAIDLVVSAEAVKLDTGQYQYVYDLHNLPSSRIYLQKFIVQTFADITPDVSLQELDKQDKLHMGVFRPDSRRFPPVGSPVP